MNVDFISVFIILSLFVTPSLGAGGGQSFLELLQGLDLSSTTNIATLVGISLLLAFIDFSWEVFNDAISYVR